MTTALATAFAELETRLTSISVANGFNTELGASVKPAGAYLDEDDAPCVALYEAQPGDDGVMRMEAGQPNACGLDFTVNYVAQAFVRRTAEQSALAAAEASAEDLMRALMGGNRGALTSATLHKINGRGRGLTPKGGDVIAVLVYGSFKINEKVYA